MDATGQGYNPVTGFEKTWRSREFVL